MYLCLSLGGGPRSVRNFDVETLNHEFNGRLIDLNFSENGGVNEMYGSFTNTISKVTDKHAQL